MIPLITVCLIFAGSVNAKFYNIHLYSENFDLKKLQDEIEEQHEHFIPFNSTMNQIHIDLYSTKFLDMVEDQIITKTAQLLTYEGECEVISTKIQSVGGKVWLQLSPNECLRQLSSKIVHGLSFYRDPYHKSNDCLEKSNELCNEYGEPDVLSSYYPKILLGFDQDYYSHSFIQLFNNFNIVRIAYSNEDRIVQPNDVLMNIVLRKRLSKY
ncbi:hypothetical protein EDI_085430 [Entamoeba dispar SAW760]|uniref:Uncharacterized protein n=1 Tax=Entamoeba dispar (strain ATCC PRA-260 / SAW760) TaxID=370354 RepID=B0EF03_ENTDS|nr:uncharacterized protein EDI_085430 [Entamoeba dispar SAW760]EDR26852.1 hypothetical protein EDI_085430 [Entamoeba dispar SAW760]|eukprot:EDR26852.1 hypothetical protein EDI_085430 [Entamoeba dispar SAW760]